MSGLAELAGALAKAGAPVLGGIVGGPVGAVIPAVIGALAEALGTEKTPEAVTTAIETNPAAVGPAVAGVESEFAKLYQVESANLAAAAKVGGDWRLFKDGWRPALCWLLAGMWANALLITPYVVALGFKVTLAPMESLVTFSALLLTILGGGHTAKEIFGARMGSARADGARAESARIAGKK